MIRIDAVQRDLRKIRATGPKSKLWRVNNASILLSTVVLNCPRNEIFPVPERTHRDLPTRCGQPLTSRKDSRPRVLALVDFSVLGVINAGHIE